jgi:AhpD family alkylhydroperoxidase
VLAHDPTLLEAFRRLYGTLWSHGVLDAPTKEVARIRNARIIACSYCRNIRFAAARHAGLQEEDVEQVAADFEHSALRERHKLAIRWTDAFLGDPTTIDAGLRDSMLREFTPEELVELSAGLALFLGFAKIAVALGQQPDAMPVTVIPTPERPA